MSKFAALDLGRVVAAHGRHCVVESPEGVRTLCHPRGKKSDCVVGDLVRWQPAGDEGVIEHIEPRRSLLHRQDEWRSKSFAANLDQVLVLVAGEPMFSESQLARALIAAESAGIAAQVLLNKCDLPSTAAARERLAPYRAMGVPVLEASLKRAPEAARALLAPLLAGRATLVLGPSGMGKSTLINLMVPGAAAQTGEISAALGAGRHTTTSTAWYWLDDTRQTALIDSPGFQEFGLRHVEALQLPGLMPDLRAHAGGCRFYNCTHRHEPGCAVIAAVERGEISASRWRIYGEICDELARERW
ncbi:MAG TPA: ribosome small subunit-dependent GTPase A [Burkholderiaceae bacterium]|nr:ribosome small subunit-dependent GTPase A [Burkholderiaceae bacterium]